MFYFQIEAQILLNKNKMITKFMATMRGYHNPKRDKGKSYDQFWLEFMAYLKKKNKKELIIFSENQKGACMYLMVKSFKATLHL